MSLRAAILLACLSALPAAAFELRRDASGEIVRWRNGATWVLDATLANRMHEPQLEAAVRDAVAAVGQASKTVALSVKVGQVGALGFTVGNGAENQNIITGLEDWPYQDKALAVTLITLNGTTHEILDADIAFNLEQHTFKVLPGANGGSRDDSSKKDDVQNTLTHELGHAVGLLHNASDETAVMYPSAQPGETSKRVLAADDRAGLSVLYENAPLEQVSTQPNVGCSAAGGSSPMATWAALVALALLTSRRMAQRARAVAVPVPVSSLALLLAVAPFAARAEEPDALDLAKPERVAVGEVVSTRSLRVDSMPGVILTELEIATRGCLKGACDVKTVIRVPGGKLGDLEQVVAHFPVPVKGESLAVLRVEGRNKLVRLDTKAAWGRFREAAARAGLVMVVSESTLSGQRNPTPAP